jgi:hypothetical protein
MPITLANRHRYPLQWGEISRSAKERAGWRCQHQGCTARQYAVGRWWRNGSRWDWIEMEPPQESYAQACQRAAEVQWGLTGDEPNPTPKIIVIVLTVAHLDHQPEHCDPANLAALCPRHHLQYDQQHHIESAYMTRMAKRGNLELPL